MQINNTRMYSPPGRFDLVLLLDWIAPGGNLVAWHTDRIGMIVLLMQLLA